MSEDIGPGDKVICLFSAERGQVVAGRIYCIEATLLTYPGAVCKRCGNGRGDNDRTLNLVGVRNDFAGWCPCRFRKAGRGGMFDQLLVVDPETTKSPVLTPNPA